MEEEKRIPLEIFDELAGVKEVSLKGKFNDTIVLFPKLTEINHSYLKETSKAFFSKVSKDFNKGIFEFFVFYRSLAFQKKEEAPSFFRTTINFVKKVKKVWDIIKNLNKIIDAFDFISNRLTISKDKGAADIGSKIRKILSPILKIKEKILNYFSFQKADVSAKPGTFKGKTPPKIPVKAPTFKSRKSILIGTLLTIGGALAINKASKDMAEGKVVSRENLQIISEEVSKSFETYSFSEKLQSSKSVYLPLLASEYERVGNKNMALMFKPLNYDLNVMPSMEELMIAYERQPFSHLLPKAGKSLPWLKLWSQFISLSKEGIILKSQRNLYEEALAELKEENKDFLAELTVEADKITEMYTEPGEYKELTLDDFADAVTLKEVVKISQKAKFNFMLETKDLLSMKRKEVAAQTRKWNKWTDIFRLLTLKLNNQ